jgi:hypothetical protein
MGAVPEDETEAAIDQLLTARGHDMETAGWEQNGNKHQCPDCGALESAPDTCSVCGWQPT